MNSATTRLFALMLAAGLPLAGCTPKDINPIRAIDPHPGLPVAEPTPAPMPEREDKAHAEMDDRPDWPLGIDKLGSWFPSWLRFTRHSPRPEQAAPMAAAAETPMAPDFVEGDDAIELLREDVFALRFLAMRRLAREDIIPAADADARIQANLGALLTLTQSPPSIGLDRPLPPIPSLIERVRALPPGSAARDYLLDSILPAKPLARMALWPADKEQARKLLHRLNALARTGLITPEGAEAEREALSQLIDSDRLPESIATTALPPEPKPKPPVGKGGAKHEAAHRGPVPKFVEDPPNLEPPALAASATGAAGMQIMILPDASQGDKAWTTMKSLYPELVPLQVALVRADLGELGTIYRIIAGPLPAEDARKTCVALKAKGQNCLPTPFPAASAITPMPAAKAEMPKADAAKTEAKKPEPVKAMEPMKPEPVKPEPVKAEPTKAEPMKAEPMKAEPAKAEAAKPEGEKPAEPAHEK